LVFWVFGKKEKKEKKKEKKRVGGILFGAGYVDR